MPYARWRLLDRGERLPAKLSRIITDKWDCTNGFEIYHYNSTYIEFLKGLEAAGVEGASDLLEAIDEYSGIVIEE